MADCASLERMCGGNSTEGSNPSLSATLRSKIRLEGTFEPEQRVCGAKRNEQPQAEPAGPSAASQSLERSESIPPSCVRSSSQSEDVSAIFKGFGGVNL